MAVIDIGPGAIDRTSYFANGYTLIDLGNPANETGTLTSIQLWPHSQLYGIVKVATFSRNGDKFTPRDVVTLASVTAGSVQTITTDSSSNPIALSVETGDYIGIYHSNGGLDISESGGVGMYYQVGDQTESGEQTFEATTSWIISIYATGVTAPTTSIKTVMGVPIENIKTINGVAIADVKSVLGVSNVE